MPARPDIPPIIQLKRKNWRLEPQRNGVRRSQNECQQNIKIDHPPTKSASFTQQNLGVAIICNIQ